MNADVIAELTSAVQKLVLYRTEPEEGIVIEARQLAAHWKFLGQPLFGSLTPDRTLVLAALVVALRSDHELLESIRRRRPEQLNNLMRDTLEADAQALAPDGSGARQNTLTPKQKYEYKRHKQNRKFTGSIEYQFGGGLESQVDWSRLLSLLMGPRDHKDWLHRSQSCLDDIFAGESVKMLRLEELFWMDRHRFRKPLHGWQPRPLNYVAVIKIMEFLLGEKRRPKPKRSTRGRSRRAPWLKDRAFRKRVLSGIQSRIDRLRMNSDIEDAFLTVIEKHLPDSGKK